MHVTQRQQSFHVAAQQGQLQYFHPSPLFGKFTVLTGICLLFANCW